MKKMKNKKLSALLIAGALAATVVCGGCAAKSLIGNDKGGNNALIVAENGIHNSKTGKIYYVGTLAEGEEDGDGSTPETFMSFSKFKSSVLNLENTDPNSLKGGDIVRIMPGEHMLTSEGMAGLIVDCNGTYENYIIFEPQDATQKTTLNFKQQTFASTHRGVQINGDYIYWHNIDVCGAGDNGLYIGGSYNVVENCEFYNNRDTGLQLGRSYSEYVNINDWPSYNLIKNCTSYNNYDNETYGENADGFAAKLTVGYGNIFDGCIAYRNSDDGWDLYAKADSGNIGAVIMYNCVAFENGFLQKPQQECNEWYGESYNHDYDEVGNVTNYITRDGDGNGFKLGGGTMEGDVILYNCMSFHNRMHGVTDNSNPGVLSINNVTSYNNGVAVDNDPASPTYGQIVISGITTNSDLCNNIDIERTVNSYNNFTNILSVNNGSDLTGTDRFRGSAEYSILSQSKGMSSKITENIDADYLGAKTGETISAPAPSAVFAELPTVELGLTEKYYIHQTYRNADGSINMGDLLKIKDYSILCGDDHKIGAKLDETSYDLYTHYNYTYLTDDDYLPEITDRKSAAELQAVKNMLYLPLNADACYQDFNAVTRITNCPITWTSSNPEVLKVGDKYTSGSSSQSVRIEVFRQEQACDVTLTAHVEDHLWKESIDVQFTVHVMPLTTELGEFVLEGVENNTVITNQFSIFTEPNVEVTNATDYNGKLLAKDAYEMTTRYLYSTEKGGFQNEVKALTTSNAGVYEVVKTAKLDSKVKSFSYNIFVVSGSATVDFTKTTDAEGQEKADVSVGVDHNGYYITGSLNNVSGTLYTLVSDGEPTVAEMISNGDSYKITSDSIYANFEADNSKAYTVYFLVCNPNGEATSQIYSIPVEIKTVSTNDEFTDLLKSGGNSSTIYLLTSDLDFTGKPWTVNSGSERNSFVGYFDGQGHTIKGINATGDKDGAASVFYQLYGGTIVNVNFADITLKGTQNVGIIGSAYSGYVANVKITDVDVFGEQRIGGLIGRAYEQVGAPLIIDRVSVINKKAGLSIRGNGSSSRAAGILGFMQNNSKPESDFVDIRITNCYVDAVIGTATTKENGGILATYDDAYNPTLKHSLEISHCVFVGTCTAQTRCGGILGYHKGIDKVRISYCVSYGTLYHAGGTEPIVTAEKNCSGILGGYSGKANIRVNCCGSKFGDHNDDYDVRTLYSEDIKEQSVWLKTFKFDTEIWELVLEGEDVVAPYIRLK